MRRVNDAGLALIKLFEGLRLKAYQCEAGRWSIGYGSTEGIRPGMVITKDTADRLFQHDVQRHAIGVEKLLKVPVSDDQFAAMVSLAFNIGLTNFASSTLLKRVNAGDLAGASNWFGPWNKVRNPETRQLEISIGLVKRREAERQLFLGRVANLHNA